MSSFEILSYNICAGVNLEARAKEIHRKVPQGTQRKITIAVARVKKSDGTEEIWVASSEPGLRPVQRADLQPGEVPITGAGHAEQTIMNAAKQKGSTVQEIAASRPICPSCAAAIQAAGAVPVSPLK
jgi:tRNA(Ile2) C34 agmatinyltransferase TiaS